MTTVARSLHVAEAEAVAYRRTWRGTVISSFVTPLLYLGAMGAGLGQIVNRGGDLGVPYLPFVATGMMAATAMQSATGDGTWPVMAGIRHRKTFFATIATPVSPAEIVYGRLMWGALRLLFILTVFGVIGVLFGALELGPALLSVAPSVLTGLAFLSCIIAYTVTREDEQALSSLFRFAIIPLFLFSGTFFPISQLPGFLQPVAYATPLFHGVELVRKIALPEGGPDIVTATPVWVHVAYLTVMAVLGTILATRFLDNRLRP
ncbi:MAG: ABC transporter permease [Acidimicrobiia bacterium]